MYVVRIDIAEGTTPSFKGFRWLLDARSWFLQACSRVADENAAAAFLFEVPGERDERRAIAAVEARRAVLLERDPWVWLSTSIKALVREAMEDDSGSQRARRRIRKRRT
jgi:hypothetical protein